MIATKKTRRISRAGARLRYLRRKARRKLESGLEGVAGLRHIRDLKSEIELLTFYSTDTAYRLRYDTMKYEYISPSITRLLGYTPEEFKALQFRSLIQKTRIFRHGAQEVSDFTPYEASRQSGEAVKWQADYLVRTKEGKHLWISDISYPWFDKDGNIIGSVGTLRDIHDRVTAEELEEQDRQQLLLQDALTGFSNRKYFFERLEQEIRRTARSHQPLALLLLDIDHFRQVNATHGHETGDHIIHEVANIIRACLRETDLAARVGGEEFAVLLPETSMQGGYWVAERIRESVAKRQFGLHTDSPVRVTVSIGVSDLSRSGSLTASELYRLADSRLFIAKHTGRNQVSVDEISVMH